METDTAAPEIQQNGKPQKGSGASKRRWIVLAIVGAALVCCGAAVFIGYPLLAPYLQQGQALQWGPKYASPGASMTFTETGSSGTPGHTVILYTITTSGLPTDKAYTMSRRTLTSTQPQQVQTQFHLDLSGRVMSPDSPTEAQTFNVQNFAKGEAFNIELATADNQYRAFGEVIPFPIEARDHNCHVWVEVESADGTVFSINGEGFVPNETITSDGHSESESMTTTEQADGSGAFNTVLLPAVIGKQSGTTGTIYTGKNCKVSISFDWGPPAMTLQ